MNYVIHLAIYIAIYSIMALSLNLVVGYTGLFSLTHAALYGVGAFATAIFTITFGLNFFATIAIGMFSAFIISLLFGLVLSRFSGDYYSLVSIGFGIITYVVYINWVWLTNGPSGFPGVPKPVLFGYTIKSMTSILVMCYIFFLVVFLACRFIVKSSFGRVLRSIRENEKAIQVYGYNTTHYKLAIFVISGMFASIAGSLFGTYMTFVGASMFTLNESIFVLLMVIMGGLSNLYGSILGAVFLTLLPEALRFIGLPNETAAQMQQIIYGTVLVLLMMFRSQGFLGEYKL